jgi:HemY protein
MRRAIGIVVLGAICVALALWLASLAGSLAFSIGDLSVELPTALAVAALALFAFLLLCVARLFWRLLTLPRWLRRRAATRRRVSGETARTAALVAIAAGDASAARREAARARRLLGDGPETLMLAAEAERLAGDQVAATRLFARLADRRDAALIGLRGLFRQAVEREDWAEASALAARAEEAYPGGQWLREERERLAARTGDWRQALALAAPGLGGSAGARAAYAVAAAEAETDAERGLNLARQAAREYPEFPPAAIAYARRLRAAGREERAQGVAARAWTARPQPDIAAFALALTTEPMQRVRAAARLVAGRPNDPESHLLLARVSLQAGLTAEARRHLDAARANGAAGALGRRGWLLLADIAAAEHGDTEEGRVAQSDALRKAAEADPDPAWRCEACGTMVPAWTPACPACHVPGRITWGPSARSLLATAEPVA